MSLNRQYLTFRSLILIAFFLASSTAHFCNNLTSSEDKDTGCFLESSTSNPARLRSSGSSLVLPCHVARSRRSTVEWWYQDFQKLVNIKIYPVFPAVRPTVLRFITSSKPASNETNETDIMDASVLLRHVNVDDSGIYRCVIRPWTPNQLDSLVDHLFEDTNNLPALTYHVELSGSRLCQSSIGALPCFSNMRTSSPTVLDTYQTAFLQCVVHNHNRPVTVFWVVGNASSNSVLVTDYLSNNQHNGDRLRRVFPLSPFDYSIELTINRNVRERAYSCVIDGATDVETTLFTFIVRTIDVDAQVEKTIHVHQNQTVVGKETEKEKVPKTTSEPIVAHDALKPEQIEKLRLKNSHEHNKTISKTKDRDEDIHDLLEVTRR